MREGSYTNVSSMPIDLRILLYASLNFSSLVSLSTEVLKYSADDPYPVKYCKIFLSLVSTRTIIII